MVEKLLSLFTRKSRIFLISLFLFLLPVTGCSRPKLTGKEGSDVDTSNGPVQIPYKEGKPIARKIKDGEGTLFPIARYKLSGVVVSKKFYSYGWKAQVAPVDLAFVWGKLAEPEYDRFMTYSQSNRWYYWRYKKGLPFGNPYIISHSSNSHIIPANKNILMAIKTIKKKEKVILEGYLANVKGRYKGGNFWWNSSLTRSDTGDGSCEVFYVIKVRIGNKVYK